jgi:hypothetical protein
LDEDAWNVLGYIPNDSAAAKDGLHYLSDDYLTFFHQVDRSMRTIGDLLVQG